MLNIDKEELKKKYKERNWNYVLKKASEISDFIISNKFKIFDFHEKEDIRQECVMNFWNKIVENKCDPDRNVFSFIWQNSTFKVLEILRKKNKRNSIAMFMPIESEDYITFAEELGDKYAFRETR